MVNRCLLYSHLDFHRYNIHRQIFPFHYFTKKSNDGKLAGFYETDGIKMYVSRGTRYWGPPMRIFAPSEITVFNFIPQNSNAKSN